MIAFKQQCTPKTKQYIDKFITYLRNNIEKKHIFNKKILNRKFSIWKEWYFNPNNLNGFIKYIKNEYKHNKWVVPSDNIYNPSKYESSFQKFLKNKHVYEDNRFTRYVSIIYNYDTADPFGIYEEINKKVILHYIYFTYL